LYALYSTGMCYCHLLGRKDRRKVPFWSIKVYSTFTDWTTGVF